MSFWENINSRLPSWDFSESDSINLFIAQALDIIPVEVYIVLFLCLCVLIVARFYHLVISI